MVATTRRTRRCRALLASVATLDEIEEALAFGADLIDLKDPSRGALGHGPPALLAAAVRAVEGDGVR